MNAGKMAAVGGTLGAVQGFNEGEDGFGSRAAHAVIPGAAGGCWRRDSVCRCCPAARHWKLPPAGTSARRSSARLREASRVRCTRHRAGRQVPVGRCAGCTAGMMASNPINEFADRRGQCGPDWRGQPPCDGHAEVGHRAEQAQSKLAQLGPEAMLADIYQFLSAAARPTRCRAERRASPRTSLRCEPSGR